MHVTYGFAAVSQSIDANILLVRCVLHPWMSVVQIHTGIINQYERQGGEEAL